MKKYILDANLFFNMEAGLSMGKKTEEVIRSVTNYSRQLSTAKRAEFYMPPRVVDEVLSFFEDKGQTFLKEFFSSIVTRSPNYGNLTLPSQAFFDLVDDVRTRNYRGQTIAEEEIQQAGKSMMNRPGLSTQDFQKAIGEWIKKFRQRYRQATRFGFLDSVADLDLILLAREEDGFLVSCDEGVMRWGRKIGVKEMQPAVWKEQLESLLHQG